MFLLCREYFTIHSFFCVLFLYTQLSFSQVNPAKINVSDLPVGIVYEGIFKEAFSWKDNLGDNVALITETGIHRSKKFAHENDGSDAELFAYHYILSKNEITQNWKVYDFIKDCPLDLEASFVKNTFRVTDLDKDGIAEVWLMYKTSCRGDVSPGDMKIIMYEAKQKHAMRGQNKVLGGIDEKGKKQYYGGEYKIDKAFTNAPKSFSDYAKKLWQENIMQSSD